MADLTDPTPTAEQLGEELRALHDRREREPLRPDEEARYAELWAWWQAGGDRAAALEAAAGPATAEPAASATADVPEEWLAAFADDAVADAAASPGEVAPESAGESDLLGEWEAWQAQQPRADPFDLLPEESASSYEDLMSARDEALGSEGAASFSGEPERDEAAARREEPAEPVSVTSMASAAAVAPPAARAEPRAVPVLAGACRVVIYLTDGQVRRGQVVDGELSSESFSYVAASGASESVPRAAVRTMFFMRSPGSPGAAPEGNHIRVTLRDGRELSGRSRDHAGPSDGFTLVPEEEKSGAALVWIARSAVRSVTVDA